MREGDKLPADSLVLSTRNIWGIIKSQKDLNLPAHKVRLHAARVPSHSQHPGSFTFTKPGLLDFHQTQSRACMACVHSCSSPHTSGHLPYLYVLGGQVLSLDVTLSAVATGHGSQHPLC